MSAFKTDHGFTPAILIIGALYHFDRLFATESECEDVTAKFKETKCFLSYERNFLRPIFNDSITTQAKQIELDRNLLLTQLEDKDIDEVAAASAELRSHLKLVFSDMLMSDQLIQSLPGHVSDGPVTMKRVQIVIERIKKISM